MKERRKSPRTLPPSEQARRAYSELWRIVDGAVADAFNMHPDYIARGARGLTVRNSINKRVVGAVLGYASQGMGSRRGG
jgi:hypothetical protein